MIEDGDRITITPISAGECDAEGCKRTDTIYEYWWNIEAGENRAGIFCPEHRRMKALDLEFR